MQMFYYVKTTIMNSRFNQLIFMWNQFDILLCWDILMFETDTTLFFFLNALDKKIEIWEKIIDRRY